MVKLIRIVIILAVFLFVLSFSKNIIAKYAIEKGVESQTGLKLNIGKFDLGFKGTYVQIKNLNLLNPSNYPDKIMFAAPEIYVNYNMESILKRKIHLEEVRLDMDQLVIVKNDQGELNINLLKPKKKESATAKAASDKSTKGDSQKSQPAETPDFQIDHCILKLGKVVYKDYTHPDNPLVKEFEVNLFEKFENITSTQDLLLIVVQRAVTKTALANIANFDIEFLKDVALQQTVDSFKEQIGSFADKIKLPFGSE